MPGKPARPIPVLVEPDPIQPFDPASLDSPIPVPTGPWEPELTAPDRGQTGPDPFPPTSRTPIPYEDWQEAGTIVDSAGVPVQPLPVVVSSQVAGPMDAFAGVVVKTYYDATAFPTGHPLLAQTAGIDARRCTYYCSTNNAPTAFSTQGIAGHPLDLNFACMPLPTRHDQEAQHVAVGDFVTILSGRDGRHFFMLDDLPFIGVVIKAEATVKENLSGGAGNVVLKVRRQAMSGTPPTWAITLADLKVAAGTNVEYTGVLTLGPTDVQHGYRCGDQVWVQRKGLYFFASPVRDSFLAKVQTGAASGPDAEGDFTDARYWVKEQVATVSYADNTWTYTLANRTQTDPSGSGGRYGRWVCAVNLAEPTGSHMLAADTVVMVHISRDPATPFGAAYWFDHPLEIPAPPADTYFYLNYDVATKKLVWSRVKAHA